MQEVVQSLPSSPQPIAPCNFGTLQGPPCKGWGMRFETAELLPFSLPPLLSHGARDAARLGLVVPHGAEEAATTLLLG